MKSYSAFIEEGAWTVEKLAQAIYRKIGTNPESDLDGILFSIGVNPDLYYNNQARVDKYYKSKFGYQSPFDHLDDIGSPR